MSQFGARGTNRWGWMDPGEEKRIISGGSWTLLSAPSSTSPVHSQVLSSLRTSVCPIWLCHRPGRCSCSGSLFMALCIAPSNSLLRASLTESNKTKTKTLKVRGSSSQLTKEKTEGQGQEYQTLWLDPFLQLCPGPTPVLLGRRGQPQT